MKRTFSVLLAIAALASAGAAAAISPGILIWADTSMREALEVPVRENPDGIFFLDRFEYTSRDYIIRISDVRLDPDPSIAWALFVIDLGAPNAFSFSFTTPIVPTAAPNIVSAGVGGVLFDATGNGFAMTPTQSELQVSTVGMPVPSTSMGVDVGTAFAAPPRGHLTAYAYGPHWAGPTSGPGPGPWTGMNATVGFSLSGGGDAVALAGFTRIEETLVPVPEASGAVLLGLGLAGGLAGWLRRRRTL